MATVAKDRQKELCWRHVAIPCVLKGTDVCVCVCVRGSGGPQGWHHIQVSLLSLIVHREEVQSG